MVLIFLFVLGSAIGSFLNVVIDRLSVGETISGRSYCDHCRHQLAWYDLIPIISFFLLKGKCRYCRKKISWVYPLVELLTGVSFLFVWQTGEKLPIRLVLFGLMSALIVIFFSDAKYQIIPDEIEISLFFFSFFLLFFKGLTLSGFINRMGAAVLVMVPILFLFLITNGRGMGFGDVKFAFAIGFLLGGKEGLLALYLAFIIGAVVGLILIFWGRKKLRSKIAFGPFLVLGVVIMLYWGERLIDIIGNLLTVVY